MPAVKLSTYFHMLRDIGVPFCMYDAGSFMKTSVGFLHY